MKNDQPSEELVIGVWDNCDRGKSTQCSHRSKKKERNESVKVYAKESWSTFESGAYWFLVWEGKPFENSVTKIFATVSYCVLVIDWLPFPLLFLQRIRGFHTYKTQWIAWTTRRRVSDPSNTSPSLSFRSSLFKWSDSSVYFSVRIYMHVADKWCSSDFLFHVSLLFSCFCSSFSRRPIFSLQLLFRSISHSPFSHTECSVLREGKRERDVKRCRFRIHTFYSLASHLSQFEESPFILNNW